MQAADVARKDAQQKMAEAMEFAQGAQRQMTELREQLEDAKFELQSIQELAQSQLQALIKCECSAAYTVETEGAAWQEYGEDAPLSVVMRLASDHLEVCSTNPCLLFCARMCCSGHCTFLGASLWPVFSEHVVSGATSSNHTAFRDIGSCLLYTSPSPRD